MWFAVSSVTMLILAGLVIDGGGQVHTQQHDDDLAAQAARAGAEALQAAPAIEGTSATIDPTNARAAAQRYLNAAGLTGVVTLTHRDTLTVTVHDSYQTQILGLIGVTHLDVTATASAHLIRTLGGNPR